MMEIRQLNFVAFGPFTGQTLRFDQEEGGLQIVYGPNEAGKSSALRGLKALLYNIDERTSDNFLHPNDKLRIEGCVRAADGQELTFARRKGRKNTLLSIEGESLDDQSLLPFLQGVPQQLFEMLFGIDHHALIQGGQEILEQKGEVGQALFSASLGSHTLHRVLGQLDQEANGLFLPQGSRPAINSALKAYTDLNREIRTQSLSAREWTEHRHALERTTKELEKIQSELDAKRVEVNRLKRIQRILPKLARRHELLQKHGALGDVIVLPDNFGVRRQEAIAERETAQVVLEKASSRLGLLQGQLNGISVRRDVLDQSENIEDLHTRLGEHRKAMRDRPHLEATYKQLLTDAESLLKGIRHDLALTDIEELRPALTKSKRIAELGNQNPVLVSRVNQAQGTLRETEAQLEEARKERQKLPAVGSPVSLSRAIAVARKLGDVDSTIESNQNHLATLEEQCAADLTRLTIWTGSMEDLPGLPVPTPENINQFEREYADLEKRTSRLLEKQEETADSVREAKRRLDELQRAGAVPTEKELIQLRTEREQAWQLLRRQWIDGEDVSKEASEIDAERALPDAFEYRVFSADAVADRLRREAERVHVQASLLAQLENEGQRAQDVEQHLNKLSVEKRKLDNEWETLWSPCKIQPRTPREMRAWLDNLEKLRERAVQLGTLQQQCITFEHSRDMQIQLLQKELHGLGKERPGTAPLEAVLLESEEVVKDLEKINRQQEMLDQEIQKLERTKRSVIEEFQDASSGFDEWKVQWDEMVKNVGLKDGLSPSEANDVIDMLRELFAKQTEAETLQIRIQAIDKDAESFSAQVSSIIANTAPEFAKLPTEEAVMRLNTLLADSRTGQSRRQQIEEQLQQVREEIQDSKVTIQSMTERLDALCMEAKRDSHTELEEAERKSAEYLGLRVEVGQVEQELLDVGEGATLEELEVETKDIDPDALPGRIDSLIREIGEELEPRQTELAERKGHERREMELMDGDAQAAALSDEKQSVLARLRSSAERYVSLKLAARILRDEIERYRKENQGPLVTRASEHFAMLTCGSFRELRADFNEKDEPVLVGIRPNEERVHVDGMSSGTRAQLYLALRLASLERYTGSSEPMPFIVDDILVDFDDKRSEAALSALAELADKTQVVLFTHHSRVVEQVRRLGKIKRVQIHTL